MGLHQNVVIVQIAKHICVLSNFVIYSWRTVHISCIVAIHHSISIELILKSGRCLLIIDIDNLKAV